MKKKRFYGNDDIQEMLYKLEKNEKLNEDKIEIDNPKQKNQKNEQKSLKHSKTSEERKKKSTNLEKCFNQESKTISNPNVIKSFWIIWPSSMNTALIILLA